MSRASIGFLLFMGVLGAALIGAAYLLGANMLAFLSHEERRSAPFVMVKLLALEPSSETNGPAAVDRERARAALETIRERFAGEPLWGATTERVLRGGVRDHWPLILLLEHPSRAQFVGQLSFGDLGNLTGLAKERFARRAVMAATPEQAFEPGDARVFVLRLVRSSGEDALAGYGERWREEDGEALARHDGVVVWQARLNPLAADAVHGFDYLMLFGFRDARARERWIDDPARATAASLQRRLFGRDVLLLLEPLDGVIAPVEADRRRTERIREPAPELGGHRRDAPPRPR